MKRATQGRGVGNLLQGLSALLLSTAMVSPAGAIDNASSLGAKNRVALVIGQSDYSGAPLKNINDADLISDSLVGAGFSVELGRDIEKQSILEKLSVLAEKSQLLGEDTTVLVYLSGRIAQINGENVFLPVGAKIDTASSASLNGFGMNQLISMMKTLPAKSRVIIIDGNAPPQDLAKERTYSPGLVKIDPPEGFLISYNQRPGVSLLDSAEPTSPYVEGFLEAMQTPTKNFSDVLQIIKKRVFDKTQGTMQPFAAENLTIKAFSFYKPTDGTISMDQYYIGDEDVTDIKSLSRDEAYKKVISIDSIQSYQSFITAFPNDEAAEVVKYNLAARREAEIWSRALSQDTPEAYWTYIKSYPNGGNVSVARYRLERMGEMDFNPPSSFQPLVYRDIPPPLPEYELMGSGGYMPMRAPPMAPSMNLSPVPIAIAATVAAVAAVAVTRGMSGGGSRPSLPAQNIRPQWAATPVVNTTVTGAAIPPAVSNTVRPASAAAPSATMSTPMSSGPMSAPPVASPAMPPASPAPAARSLTAPVSTAPTAAALPSSAPASVTPVVTSPAPHSAAPASASPSVTPLSSAPAVRPLGAPAGTAPAVTSTAPASAGPAVTPLSSTPAVRPLGAPAGTAPAVTSTAPASAGPAVTPLSTAPAVRPLGATAGTAPAVIPLSPSSGAAPTANIQPIRPVMPNAPAQAGSAPQQSIAPKATPQMQSRTDAPVQQQFQRQQPVQQQQMRQAAPVQRQVQAAPVKTAPAKPTCTPQMRQAKQC